MQNRGRVAGATFRLSLLGAAGLPALVLAAGCAARTAPPVRVDLAPAREALENARLLSLDTANECFVKAEGHLNEAESLAGTRDPEKSRQAEWLARLSLVESHCAATIAKLAESQRAAAAPVAAGRNEELEAARKSLRSSEDERRKLEERVAVLQRTLEVTETEVIRAKAKLKGIETRAEASSAIAEARILLQRLKDEKKGSASLALSQDKLDQAAEQLQAQDYSMAAFYALQAQEILEGVRRGLSLDPERAAPKKEYTVQANVANIRKEPDAKAPLVGKVPKGTVLQATGMRTGWVKVKHEQVEGWVSRALLE